MAKKAAAVLVMAVLGLSTACAPAAPPPTQTPQSTTTPVVVRATKPEHLTGIWLLTAEIPNQPYSFGGPYYRWDTDGTVWWAEDAAMTKNLFSAKFWFEDGLYHENESPICEGLGIYEIYLEIEGGRAVLLRMRLIEDGPHEAACSRVYRYAVIHGGGSFIRVD